MKQINSFLTTLFLSILLSVGICGDASIVPHLFIGIEILSLVVPKGVLGADVYADTVLQAARAFIKNENNRKFQLRPTITNALDVFMKDREYTIPNLAAIRQATTQTTSALYLKKKSFTVGTSKSCSPSGEQSGSAKVDLTWATKKVVIKTNFKQHAGNEVSMAMAFANDLYNAEVSLFTSLDQTLVDYLETNKSGVNNGGSGTFDATNDLMAITNSNKNFFYNLLTADMQTNNYMPTFNEVHSTMWTATQRQYINQGAGNTTNTQFQFAGFEFFPSNLITPGAIGNNTYTSLHYIVPDGGVAILDWNDPLNVQGKVSGEKLWGTYQSILHPEITFDLYRISTCADTSADGGGTQDYVETWELAMNYAIAKQPVPTALETPIYKYGVLSGDTFTS